MVDSFLSVDSQGRFKNFRVIPWCSINQKQKRTEEGKGEWQQRDPNVKGHFGIVYSTHRPDFVFRLFIICTYIYVCVHILPLSLNPSTY